MAGRPKMKMYEYDKKGKFVREYKTQVDVFNLHYEGKKRPLVRTGKEYGILPNGNFICEAPIGRQRLMRIMRIERSKYVSRTSEKRVPIAAFNLIGEKIATFRSTHMASVLTGIDRTTIDHALKANPTGKQKYTKSTELIFKYEENVVPLQ